MSSVFGIYFALLGLTCAVEGAIALALTPAPRRLEVGAVAVCMNLVTQPLLMIATVGSDGAAFLPGELAVVALEALGFRVVARLSPGRSLALSLAMNVPTLVIALSGAI